MTDEGTGPSGAADADERVVEFLRTTDRPRHLASEVSAALDLPRGRVRTRLQALADDGRVVRTDAERTARWAVPDRADEPEPEPAADGAAGDEEPAADDAARDEEPAADRAVEDHTGDDDRTEAHDDADALATPEGPAGVPDRRTDDAPIGSPSAASVGRGRRLRGSVGWLALLVGLVVALVALGRLRRR